MRGRRTIARSGTIAGNRGIPGQRWLAELRLVGTRECGRKPGNRILSAVARTVVAALLLCATPNSALGAGNGPTVVLDRLEFPAMVGAEKFKHHLKRILKREVHRVNWGASSDSTIEYRFVVRSLKVANQKDVLKVECDAEGILPGGRTAKSRLSFGGDPRNHSKVIRHVLTIVARGVIARLAEMERVRRGHLPDQDVRTPD